MAQDYLWTPWRMQYIDKAGGDSKPTEAVAQEKDAAKGEGNAGGKNDKSESTGCVFCDKLTGGPEHDRENLVLLRGKQNFIILNLFPYNSAHLMVVPYEHTDDYATLDQETSGEMTAFVQRMLRVIKAEYRPQGFNLGLNMGRVAGAGVADHVHMHVVPRWAGDSNFMPIVGSTKVMPELLETTYDRLKARMESVQ